MYIVLASSRIYSARRQAITRDDDDDDDEWSACHVTGTSDEVLLTETSSFALILSLLLKEHNFNFNLLLLQLMLCRVAPLKGLPLHRP